MKSASGELGIIRAIDKPSLAGRPVASFPTGRDLDEESRFPDAIRNVSTNRAPKGIFGRVHQPRVQSFPYEIPMSTSSSPTLQRQPSDRGVNAAQPTNTTELSPPQAFQDDDIRPRPNSPSRPKKTRPPKLTNPLQAGIATFLTKRHHSLRVAGASGAGADWARTLPKRYTLYPPLLLLPPNVFTATPAWRDLFDGLEREERWVLISCVVDAFGCLGVTHVAINAPISAGDWTSDGNGGMENIMRRPTRMVPVYGDFGPSRGVGTDLRREKSTEDGPEEADFEAALWVQAVQNGGIVQIWAPLWTMFSRGNIKEKARILDEGPDWQGARFPGLDGVAGVLGERLEDISVLDLYIGIGYFAFSYLKRGVGLVWGWEMNGWSVEGLRRGCEANGWKAKVLRLDEGGVVIDGRDEKDDKALEDLVGELQSQEPQVRCVVFWGDNRWAGAIMARLKTKFREMGKTQWKNVRHASLGLLPTSRGSWENAVQGIDSKKGGWLHIHENVDSRAIESKRQEIVADVRTFVRTKHLAERDRWEASCCHTEQVKTYAPGVMHCVFDVQVLPLVDTGVLQQ